MLARPEQGCHWCQQPHVGHVGQVHQADHWRRWLEHCRPDVQSLGAWQSQLLTLPAVHLLHLLQHVLHHAAAPHRPPLSPAKKPCCPQGQQQKRWRQQRLWPLRQPQPPDHHHYCSVCGAHRCSACRGVAAGARRCCHRAYCEGEARRCSHHWCCGGALLLQQQGSHGRCHLVAASLLKAHMLRQRQQQQQGHPVQPMQLLQLPPACPRHLGPLLLLPLPLPRRRRPCPHSPGHVLAGV